MPDQYQLSPEYENSFQETQFELLPEYETTQSGTSNPRNTTTYIQWIQASLNQLMGQTIPVNGVMTIRTRNAIRSFQRMHSLTVDGVVGPNTERALILAGANSPTSGTSTTGTSTGGASTPPVTNMPAPVNMPPITVQPRICPVLPLTRVIDGYALGAKQLSKAQVSMVTAITKMIFDSLDPALACNQPVTSVDVVGFTDNIGSTAANTIIGQRRANEVAAVIANIISIPLMVGHQNVPTVTPTSQGPNNPVANNSTAAGRVLNRRVEVTLR